MAPRDDGPWGVREIAKGVGMNPSTVHRLLGLLEEEGLVRQDDAALGEVEQETPRRIVVVGLGDVVEEGLFLVEAVAGELRRIAIAEP